MIEGGDHWFKIARVGQAGQGAVHGAIQETIVTWIADVMRKGH